MRREFKCLQVGGLKLGLKLCQRCEMSFVLIVMLEDSRVRTLQALSEGKSACFPTGRELPEHTSRQRGCVWEARWVISHTCGHLGPFVITYASVFVSSAS